MKKLVVFVVLATVLLGSCSNENKIVGTWTDIEGSTWVFTSDGKITYTEPYGSLKEYRYSVFDGEQRTKLTIFEVSWGYFNSITDQEYTMEFSKDGKTLRLTGGDDLNGWSVAGPGWSKNELTQKKPLTSSQIKQMQKNLVGTWIEQEESDEIIFSANGKATLGNEEFDYRITDTKLELLQDDEVWDTVDFSITDNGKTLILNFYGEKVRFNKK